ncbi:hypothetical protein [Aestuariibaculum suncheonense]|uniref:Uncharacterized protein n=1 Tax=Aestuariibaculum suncheonense TaxID=1028745 RepID=A0A8J6UAS3_9FLAO|nr:hypothetical protein [Aestuariibaculum suncheonense]MBD0835633.1 hypothetical protein [Aestuariibaculum suncheonense]
MKPIKSPLKFSVFLIIVFSIINMSNAQSKVPEEVSALVKMDLEEGQAKLKSLGYEICFSSLLGKKQDWFKESENSCITLKFDKRSKEITEVALNPNISQCQQRLEASRKVWEKYHDGQAPASSSKLDDERQKLVNKGFKVSYWVDEISPGRCIEYWINETTKKAMYIVWEVQGNRWATTDKTEYDMGKNPAPIKK